MGHLRLTDHHGHIVHEQPIMSWKSLDRAQDEQSGVEDEAEEEEDAETMLADDDEEATREEMATALAALREETSADPHTAELLANATLMEYRRCAARAPGGVLEGDRCGLPSDCLDLARPQRNRFQHSHPTVCWHAGNVQLHAPGSE
jgi:hypothetical protein